MAIAYLMPVFSALLVGKIEYGHFYFGDVAKWPANGNACYKQTESSNLSVSASDTNRCHEKPSDSIRG